MHDNCPITCTGPQETKIKDSGQFYERIDMKTWNHFRYIKSSFPFFPPPSALLMSTLIRTGHNCALTEPGTSLDIVSDPRMGEKVFKTKRLTPSLVDQFSEAR